MSSREDALRHLCAFQCSRCREVFGNSSALKRHTRVKERCKRMGQNRPKPGKINPQLAEAIKKLQEARDEKVFDAINACMKYHSKFKTIKQELDP